MEERLLTVQDVAYRVGCSIQTIGGYYKFKKENPSNEYSLMLPDYVRKGNKNTRYWKESDVADIIKFRTVIPQGRSGALGSVTQKYVNKSAKKVRTTKTASDFKPVKAGMPKRAYIDKIEIIMQASDVDVDVIAQVRELLESELEFRCYMDMAN